MEMIEDPDEPMWQLVTRTAISWTWRFAIATIVVWFILDHSNIWVWLDSPLVWQSCKKWMLLLATYVAIVGADIYVLVELSRMKTWSK
jgi:hypothetical protein